MPGPLFQAFEELRDYARDVGEATYQTVDNAMRRFVGRLDSDPIRGALAPLLPDVDFDTWYAAAEASAGPMAGSAELDWPLEAPRRVALQLELMRRLASERPGIIPFCIDFCNVSSYHNDNIREFARQVLVPFHRDLIRLVRPILEAEESETPPAGLTAPPAGIDEAFIDPRRLSDLRGLESSRFDFQRLVRLCEELNICYGAGAYLAVAALTRALMDHIPPIFGVRTFAEVANNHSGGRSFGESMQHLESSARRIGDAHLHVQIRSRESLPTATQVNFRNDLDVLIGEIVRMVRAPAA